MVESVQGSQVIPPCWVSRMVLFRAVIPIPLSNTVAVSDGEPLQDDVIGGDLDAAHRGPIGRQPDRASAVPHLVIATSASARLPSEKPSVSPWEEAFSAAGTSSALTIVRVLPGGRLWRGCPAAELRPAEVHPAASNIRPSNAIDKPDTVLGRLDSAVELTASGGTSLLRG